MPPHPPGVRAPRRRPGDLPGWAEGDVSMGIKELEVSTGIVRAYIQPGGVLGG